jgi:hypothetical protein
MRAAIVNINTAIQLPKPLENASADRLFREFMYCGGKFIYEFFKKKQKLKIPSHTTWGRARREFI